MGKYDKERESLGLTSSSNGVSVYAEERKQIENPVVKKAAPKTTPSKTAIPKVTPEAKKFNPSPWSKVQTEFNMSQPGIGNQIAKTLPTVKKQEIAQGTAKFFKEAPVQAGFMQGVSLNNPLKSLERKLDTKIKAPTDSLAYKAGNIGGTIAQFAVPYTGAAKGVGLLIKAALPKLGKIGSKVAASVATDLAVGLPLNINQAYNKDSLKGTDALKSIGMNTGIDLIAGGVLETLGVILKSGKKVTSKVEFEKLPPAEKQEVLEQIKMLPAPKENLNESKLIGSNKVIADGQILDRKFSPVKKDDALQELAQRLSKLPNAKYAPGLYSPNIQSKIDKIGTDINSISKMTDDEFNVHAEKNGLGNYTTDFKLPQFKKIEPLQFKTQMPTLNEKAILEPMVAPNTQKLYQLEPELGMKVPKEQTPAPKEQTITEKPLNVNEKVIGIERGNQGRIATINKDGSYLIHFLNKQNGQEALVKMQREEFEPIQKTIDEVKRMNLRPDKLIKDPTSLDELAQSHKTVSDLEYLKAQGSEIDEEILKAEKRKIKVANMERKTALKDYTDKLTETSDKWKDKAMLMLQRETWDRNIIDVAGKDGKAIKEQIFDRVKTNEADRQRFINKSRNEIKTLKLSKRESELVQQFGEGKIISLPLDVDQLKISNAVQVFKNWYSDTIDEANQVLLQNGYKPVPKRDNYFPHFKGDDPILKALGIRLDMVELPTDINGLTANFKPGKNFFNNFQKRSGKETTYDAVQGFDRYVEGISKVIHHTEDIQTLRSLNRSIRTKFSDPEISKRIEEVYKRDDLTEEEIDQRITELAGEHTHLSNVVADLEEYTNVLAGKKDLADRASERRFGRKVYNLTAFLENRIGKNMVALNPASWLTNFIPLTQSLATTNKKAFLQAMNSTVRGMVKDDGFVNRSTFLTSRYGNEVLDKGFMDKSADILTAPFKWIDQFTSNVVTRAKYLEGINKGAAPEQAMKVADDWASKMMGDRSFGAQPTLFNQREPMVRLITQFQLEVNNQLSFILKDVPRAYKESSEGKEWIAKTASAMAQLAIYGWLYNQAYESAVGRRPAIDPISVAYTMGKGFKEGDSKAILKTGIAALQQLPFSSTFVGGGRIPISSAIPNFGTIGTEGAKFATGDKTGTQFAKTVGKEMVKPAAYLIPPFGGGQIKKTIEGALALKNGSQGNNKLRFPIEKTPVNIGKTLVFGQYSSNEGKKYLKEDGRMLTEKQTVTFKEITKNGGEKEVFDFITQNKTDKTGSEPKPHTKASIIRALRISKLPIDQQRALLTQFYGYKL